ncbi:MAG: DUF1667 domain-containing protein [Spirochaetia bacterium]
MKKEMICISCPIGCHLTAEWTNEDDISISGNRCKRGIIYGTEEIRAPKRVVTATIAVNSEILPRVPVKTDSALLKELIDPLMNTLYTMKLEVPVKMGDVLIEDIEGSGVNLVATRSVTG